MLFKEILRQQIKIASYAAEACTEERTLISSCAWNQSHCGQTPSPQPQDQDTTRTGTAEPSQRQRVPCPGRSCVDAPYRKWPISKVLQLRLGPITIPHTYSLIPLKTHLDLGPGGWGFWALVSILWVVAFIIKQLGSASAGWMNSVLLHWSNQ